MSCFRKTWELHKPPHWPLGDPMGASLWDLTRRPSVSGLLWEPNDTSGLMASPWSTVHTSCPSSSSSSSSSLWSSSAVSSCRCLSCCLLWFSITCEVHRKQRGLQKQISGIIFYLKLNILDNKELKSSHNCRFSVNLEYLIRKNNYFFTLWTIKSIVKLIKTHKIHIFFRPFQQSTLFAVSMTTSMLRFWAAMASSSSSSSLTSQASLVMLSNSWKVVAFLGLPGVAGGGREPAFMRLGEGPKNHREIMQEHTWSRKYTKSMKWN